MSAPPEGPAHASNVWLCTPAVHGASRRWVPFPLHFIQATGFLPAGLVQGGTIRSPHQPFNLVDKIFFFILRTLKIGSDEINAFLKSPCTI